MRIRTAGPCEPDRLASESAKQVRFSWSIVASHRSVGRRMCGGALPVSGVSQGMGGTLWRQNRESSCPLTKYVDRRFPSKEKCPRPAE